MKKFNRNLVVLCVAILLIFGCFFANFKANNVVFAENEQVVELLSENYDGANASSFTPFDFETGERKAGKSLKPIMLSDNTFSEEISLNYFERLYENDNNTLGLWIYFSNKNLHNLKFTFVAQDDFGNEASLIFVLNSEILGSKLEKTKENIDLEDDGYGWNYIEIPFSMASSFGAVENGEYRNFQSLRIDYTSSSIDNLVTYSEVYLYDISIYSSDIETLTVKEENKQPYRFCKFDFYSTEELNQVYLGDALSLPSRTSSLQYAWVGEEDIKLNANSYSYKVIVSTDSGEDIWEFGSSFTFNTSGNTIVKFEINNNNDNILWQAHSFYVDTFVGLSFNQTITQFSTGKTVRIYLTTNSNLTEISSLNFEIVGDCATITNVNLQNLYVDVKMNSAGSFVLKATANGARLFDDEISLVCQCEFSVVGNSSRDNRGLVIAMSVFLGVVAVVGIAWGIKVIISTNKYKVR